MRLFVSVSCGVCALLLFPARAPAQAGAMSAAQRLTESDAIARFLASDPRIRALNARVEEVRASHAERALWPNPVVTFTRESAASSEESFLLARQELPVPGRMRQLRAAGRAAVEAARADARSRTALLLADLREAYAALQLAQEAEGVLREGLGTLQELVRLLRAREEGGEGSSYDRIRGARAMLDLEADLAAAGAARAKAQGRLAAYLGAAAVPGSLIAADALMPVATVPPVEAVLKEALSNRSDYGAARLSIAQFDAERQAAARLRLPTPTVSGGLKRSDFGAATASGYQFAVDVSVPLFNRGQAAVALADARKAHAEAEADAWRTTIEAEVRTAHAALAIQEERAARYRQAAADLAEPLAEIGRIAYQEGELSILELLDAERQALDARLRISNLAAAARRAAIELDRAIGREFRP